MKTRSKTTKPTIENLSLDSMEQCAALTGISKETQQHAKAQGCTAFRNSRIYPLELCRWIFNRGDSEVKNWSEHNKKLDARLKELEIGRQEGELIMKTEVQECVGKLMTILTGALRRLAVEFPKSLEHRSAIEIKSASEQAYREVLNKMQAEIESMQKPSPPQSAQHTPSETKPE